MTTISEHIPLHRSVRLEGIYSYDPDSRTSYIVVQDNGSDIKLKIERANIADGSEKSLVPGETVSFLLSEEEPLVRDIRRRYPRYIGKVIQAASSGIATVTCDELPVDRTVIEIKTSNIVSQAGNNSSTDVRRYVDAGEFVEFSLKDGDSEPDIIVRVDPSSFIYKFSINNNLKEDHIPKLERLAQAESWKHRDDPLSYKYPVLLNYIKYTFARVREQNKIEYGSTDSGTSIAVWNTGLITKGLEEIYALHYPAKIQKENGPKWFFSGFIASSDKRMLALQKPQLASYISDPSDIFFDVKKRIEIDTKHILEERVSRLPEKFAGRPREIAYLIDAQREDIIRRITRNYKTAVPQFQRGNIQLLVPLSLTEESMNRRKADAALMLLKGKEAYLGKTILPLPYAYNNARLVTKPDDEWI